MGKTDLTKEMKDDYEKFIKDIPALLAELQKMLKESRKYKKIKVSYDDRTLGEIESFYLAILSGKEKIKISQDKIDRIFMAFMGDALISRSHTGLGQWRLSNNFDSRNFGTPVVFGYTTVEHMAYSPFIEIEHLKETRKPALIEEINYCIDKEDFEKNLFKDFE